MATEEEIRYYQSLTEEQKRNYTRRMARGLPLSGEPLARDQFDVPKERAGRKAALIDSMRPHRQPAREAPREQPRITPRAAQPGLGSRIATAGKNWLENAAANSLGREPPHKAKSAAGRWLSNASANINSGRVNMGWNPLGNPLGGMNFPAGPPGLPPGLGLGPAPRAPPRQGKKKKKKHRRKESEEQESRPWESGHIPPGLRDLF